MVVYLICLKLFAIHFRLKMRSFFFLFVFACRPHVSDRNGHRKRNFLKTMAVEFDLVTLSFSKSSVLRCPHENGIFKNLLSGERF